MRHGQKSEKCIERAESLTETLATQAIDLLTTHSSSFGGFKHILRSHLFCRLFIYLFFFWGGGVIMLVAKNCQGLRGD